MTYLVFATFIITLILILAVIVAFGRIRTLEKNRVPRKEVPSLVNKPLCSLCHGPVGETPTEVYMEIPMPPDGKILPVTLKVCEKH